MAGPAGLTVPGRLPGSAAARAVTIHDVARAAGVSRQTVTRAVNRMPGISESTRERVLEQARRLGYRPSRYGRDLVRRSSRTLGLLVGDLANPYYPELASAVLKRAARAGWHVVLAEHGGGPPGALEAFAARVDAAIAFTGSSFPEDVTGAAPLPLVEIDPQEVRGGRGRVELDMRAAVADAVEHLLERGTDRPVLLDLGQSPSRRGRLFLDAFAARGVPLARERVAAADLAGGEEGCRAALERRQRPDAVVAFNDVTALGALRALRRAGADVPGEVRVVGVDGLGIGAYVAPRLTTLALDVDAAAREALDLVLALHASPPEPGAPAELRRTVAHRLVVGEST